MQHTLGHARQDIFLRQSQIVTAWAIHVRDKFVQGLPAITICHNMITEQRCAICDTCGNAIQAVGFC
jgi:hypothetical protein